MGAWIEITPNMSPFCAIPVAPLVGAWIEIVNMPTYNHYIPVAPLVGAWIEIYNSFAIRTPIWSLPSWERGLKYDMLI